MATAAIARGEATRTRKADNNKFVNSLSINHEKIQGSDALDLREFHMALNLPAAAADPAGGADPPDEQEPDPERDEQEPEPEGYEQVTTPVVDYDKFVEESRRQALMFEEFVEMQTAEKVKDEQREAEHFYQLSLGMGLGMSTCAYAWASGYGQQQQQTTARARGLAATGSGGSSSSGSAAMAAASLAGRPAWHGFPVTQLQRDFIKKLCQEVKIDNFEEWIPDNRGQASDAIGILIAMKRAHKSG